MDAQTFIQTVRNNCDQTVRVTFMNNKEGITALSRLSRAYCGPGKAVKIPETDWLFVAAVCASRNWETNANRTVTFKGLETLDDNTLSQFARDIEKIAV